jgi:hypothetical protein
MWDWWIWTTAETVNRRRRTASRTHLKPGSKRLLERIQGQRWTVEGLRWVLRHLDAPAPTLIVQELHATPILLSAQGRETRHGKIPGPVDGGAAPW